MRNLKVLLAVMIGLVFAFNVTGCKKKKKSKDGSDVDAGLADGMEEEANTGPMEYPEPPRVDAEGRNPLKYTVSIKKAYVLPLSEEGACWDSCPTENKPTLIDALPNLAGEQFAAAGKALQTALSASDLNYILPDIYVHVDCGFGQEFTTSKASAEDRIVARWQGAKEILKLDPNDYCAISVWDADEDDNDEKIGAVDVKLLKATTTGEVFLSGDDEDFGQVVMLEIFLDQHEGTPVWQGGGTTPGGTTPGGTTPGGTTPGGTTPGGTTPSPGSSTTPPPAHPGQHPYIVEVIKANMKAKKSDGKPWDTKIPFMAGGVMPDPYVEGYVNGYRSENPFMSTSVAGETTYKEWRETGGVNLRPDDKIHFMVWDKDKVDPDLMGECISNPVQNLPIGSEIVIKNCSQVEFFVFKLHKQ